MSDLLWGVIFDVDGVLIDSVAAAYRMRSRLLATYGVDLTQVPDPHNESHKGSSLEHLLAAVHQHTGIKIDEETYARQALASMPEEFKGAKVDEKLVTLLEELKEHNVPCAIASSGRADGVRIKLETLGIMNYFAQIVTAQDVTHHKPHPEIYELAAMRLGLEPKYCVAVEDSTAGVTAGKSAGCTVVGFTQFNSDKQALAGTKLTVDSWEDLSYSRLRELLTTSAFRPC